MFPKMKPNAGKGFPPPPKPKQAAAIGLNKKNVPASIKALEK